MSCCRSSRSSTSRPDPILAIALAAAFGACTARPLRSADEDGSGVAAEGRAVQFAHALLAAPSRACSVARRDRVATARHESAEQVVATNAFAVGAGDRVRLSVLAAPLRLELDAEGDRLRLLRSAPLELGDRVLVFEGSCLGIDATLEGSAGALDLTSTLELRLCAEGGLEYARIEQVYRDGDVAVSELSTTIDCRPSPEGSSP